MHVSHVKHCCIEPFRTRLCKYSRNVAQANRSWYCQLFTMFNTTKDVLLTERASTKGGGRGKNYKVKRIWDSYGKAVSSHVGFSLSIFAKFLV